MALTYYMDVHIPAAITEGLRRRGIDVLTSQDDDHRTSTDEELLERATSLNRLLVTQDDDYLRIAADWHRLNRRFFGIVYSHQLGPGIGEIIEDLELLALAAECDEVENRLTYLPLR